MKKLLFIITMVFAALFYACTALAQIQFKSPSGVYYYTMGAGSDVIVYMHGYEENPLNSYFYKSFYPSIKDKVTLYMGLIPGSAGWEKPWAGVTIGEDFLKFVVSENAGRRIYVTGFSAGADPDYIFNVTGITAFASVAGKSDSNERIKTWAKTGIPVYAFAGTKDTSNNPYNLCVSTWTGKFQGAGGNLTWKSIDGATHGGTASYAYNPANGLWAWFDSIGKPVDPPINPVVKIPPKISYFDTGENKFVVELENGQILKFSPD